MPWARASSLDRHLACPASSRFPRFDRGAWAAGYTAEPGLELPITLPEPRDTSAADWGVAMHAAKALAPDAADPWLTLMEPHRGRLWPAGLGTHELSVSYDCKYRTVEMFTADTEEARNIWKASRGPDTVVGTCDWWGSLPTGEPWVDDLKTGWRTPDVLTPQLMFYLMTRMLHDLTWTTGRVSITHWPRKEKEPTRSGLWRQVSSVDLSAFQEELHRAWRAAVAPTVPAIPGPHCGYCPSATVCDRADNY